MERSLLFGEGRSIRTTCSWGKGVMERDGEAIVRNGNGRGLFRLNLPTQWRRLSGMPRNRRSRSGPAQSSCGAGHVKGPKDASARDLQRVFCQNPLSDKKSPATLSYCGLTLSGRPARWRRGDSNSTNRHSSSRSVTQMAIPGRFRNGRWGRTHPV